MSVIYNNEAASRTEKVANFVDIMDVKVEKKWLMLTATQLLSARVTPLP